MWLVSEAQNGLFCCGGPLNNTSDGEACIYPSYDDSYAPVSVGSGWVLFPNTSQTLTEYGDAAAAELDPPQNPHGSQEPVASPACSAAGGDCTALGAGLGAVLGASLLLALLALAWQWKRANALAKKLDVSSVGKNDKEQMDFGDVQLREEPRFVSGGVQHLDFERHEAPHSDSQIHEVPSLVERRELEAHPSQLP